MHRSDEAMNSIGNLKKNHYFRSFLSKAKNFVVFALTMCFALFHGDFCIDLNSVESGEARR